MVTQAHSIYTMLRGGYRAAKGQKKSSQDKFLSRDEFRHLLGVTSSDSEYYGQMSWDLFALAGNFGLRCGEAVGLTADNFTPIEFGYFRVHTLKKRANIEDRVYVGKSGIRLVREILARRGQHNGRLFPFTTRTARYYFAYYAKRAGLSANVSFHSLRHTTARMILEATGDGDPTKGSLRIVRAILRHSPNATEIYTEPSPEELIRAMEKKGIVR